MISPLFFQLKFQFAKVFQFRRGTPLAVGKSRLPRSPQNESVESRYGGNFTFVQVPSCDHFIVEVLKSEDLKNFRAKKKVRDSRE